MLAEPTSLINSWPQLDPESLLDAAHWTTGAVTKSETSIRRPQTQYPTVVLSTLGSGTRTKYRPVSVLVIGTGIFPSRAHCQAVW
jgi:hypothetical protein